MVKHSLQEILRMCGAAAQRAGPNLDCGGCAVYAYLLGKRLRAKGYRVDVRAWGHPREESIRTVRARLKADTEAGQPWDMSTWELAGMSFNHILLRVVLPDGTAYYVDSTGAVPATPTALVQGRHVRPGGMTLEELKPIAGSAEDWNTRFNRKHIPKVARAIRRHITSLEAPHVYQDCCAGVDVAGRELPHRSHSSLLTEDQRGAGECTHLF